MGTLKLITLWFDPLRFATLSALVVTIGTIGNLTASTPLVFMVTAIGWRMTFTVFAGGNLLLTILFYLVVRDRPTEAIYGEIPQEVSTSLYKTIESIKALFREKDYWVISFSTFCRYGI